MACPDELTLDLWMADALPADEAARVFRHVASCARCASEREQSQVTDAQLRAALVLDSDELAYVSRLDLAAAWRTRPAHVTDSPWGWLALFGVVATFLVWTLAAQPFGELLGTANVVGLGTVLLTAAVRLVLDLGPALIDVATSPALGLTEPLLALLALAFLLFWPRLKAAPHYLEGVHS